MVSTGGTLRRAARPASRSIRTILGSALDPASNSEVGKGMMMIDTYLQEKNFDEAMNPPVSRPAVRLALSSEVVNLRGFAVCGHP